jgi:hypothetical protein
LNEHVITIRPRRVAPFRGRSRVILSPCNIDAHADRRGPFPGAMF